MFECLVKVLVFEYDLTIIKSDVCFSSSVLSSTRDAPHCEFRFKAVYVDAIIDFFLRRCIPGVLMVLAALRIQTNAMVCLFATGKRKVTGV